MKIYSISDGTISYTVRVGELANRLEEEGHDVISVELSPYSSILAGTCDIAVFERPINPMFLSTFRALGAKIIVDIDDDFASIPQNHPGYSTIGNGAPFVIAAHRECLRMADALIVSTRVLAERFADVNKNIFVIPNGWDDKNEAWTREIVKSKNPENFTLGWGGTITHRADFSIALPAIRKVMSKYPNVDIWISGDPEIYEMLTGIPQRRKMFLPFMPYDLWPLFIGAADLFLVPLKVDTFNLAKSDIKLCDSGARSVPWIASEIQQYVDWCSGGTLAKNDEWEKAISSYIESQDLCKEHALAGREKAEERTLTRLFPLWKEAIGL